MADEDFDKSERFEQEVRPLLDKVREKCLELGVNGMTMFDVAYQAESNQLKISGNEIKECFPVESTNLILCRKIMNEPNFANNAYAFMLQYNEMLASIPSTKH